MGTCLIFILSSGLTLGTFECQPQLFYGDGLVTPHEVVYTSHIDDCWDGYLVQIPSYRVSLRPSVREVRYHTIRRRHINRIRYRGKVYRHKKHRIYRKRPIVRKRHPRLKPIVRNRTVIKNRRVINNHYYNNKKKRRGKKGKKHKK
tara:strand:+ start:840 stop:1277 length:438 start_codon:yes stop_codon:yes gene_type:complete